MTKLTKTWLMIAASLILIGGIVFAVVMTTLNWDFTKLSTSKYEKTSFVLTKQYRNIKISTKEADIIFLPSETEYTTVECFENKNAKHKVKIEDGMLEIRVEDNRKWFQFVGINWSSPKITVYIPKGEYGAFSLNADTGIVEIPKDFSFERMDIAVTTGSVTNYASALDAIKIKTSTGKIVAENITAKELDLSTTTGNIEASGIKVEGEFRANATTGKTTLTNVTCRNVVSKADTGDIILTSVVATETFSIKRSTGSVVFEKSDATELYVETNTGSVKGSLITPKVFIAETDTGTIDLPKTTEGGKCEITTDTGNIKIEIAK